MIRVAIADDHRVVRVGLEQLLATFDDVELVGSADGGEAAAALVASTKPDVVLLDLSMPDLDGIEVTRRAAAASPETRVVLFTSFSDRDQILQALDAGAIGYLLKDTMRAQLVQAIHAAARGLPTLDPRAQGRLMRKVSAPAAPSPFAHLTPRELDVLRLIARGHANKQIAAALHLSVGTVKGYISAMLPKIGAGDRTQAALLASKHGLDAEGATEA